MADIYVDQIAWYLHYNLKELLVFRQLRKAGPKAKKLEGSKSHDLLTPKILQPAMHYERNEVFDYLQVLLEKNQKNDHCYFILSNDKSL